MEFTFRKANENDIDDLAGLLAELFSMETDFSVNRDLQKAGLALFFKNLEEKVIFVAESKGAVIGMITCQLVISTAAGGYSILLEDMFVQKRFRCKGIGTSFVRMVQKWGEKKGASRIQLVADKRNKSAHIFYRTLGFQTSRMNGLYLPLE